MTVTLSRPHPAPTGAVPAPAPLRPLPSVAVRWLLRAAFALPYVLINTAEGVRDVPLVVDYQSAAAAAQKSSEAASMVRVVTDIAPLAQVNPRVTERIDPDGYIEALSEARGTPAGFLLSRDEADELGTARGQDGGQRVRMIAEFLGGLLDPGPHLGRHGRALGERA